MALRDDFQRLALWALDEEILGSTRLGNVNFSLFPQIKTDTVNVLIQL